MTGARQIFEQETIDVYSVLYKKSISEVQVNKMDHLFPSKTFKAVSPFLSQRSQGKEYGGDSDTKFLKCQQTKHIYQYEQNVLLFNGSETVTYKMFRSLSVTTIDEQVANEKVEEKQDSNSSRKTANSLFVEHEKDPKCSKNDDFLLEMSSSVVKSENAKVIDVNLAETSKEKISCVPITPEEKKNSISPPERIPRKVKKLSSRARSHTASSLLKIRFGFNEKVQIRRKKLMLPDARDTTGSN